NFFTILYRGNKINNFSKDIDILRLEPNLFSDLYFASQQVSSGSGASLSESKLNATDVNFIECKIEPGMVVYLRNEDGSIDGLYEIASINSASQVTISVLRNNGQTEIIPVKNANNLTYRICTYQAQSNEIFLQLAQHFGLRPGISDGQYSVDDILDTSVLRQVSVYGVISGIYATLAGRNDDAKEGFWKKSVYYKQLYEKAMQRCRVSIDLGDDGIADFAQSGASIRLLRD
ncbi:MAG: hypothetical protein ABFD79_18655, partial [Phycisphaerales bacterium]